MLRQLKFAWSDICEHPIAFFFNFIQVLIALILIGSMTNGLSDLTAFKERMNGLENTENSYMIIDNTDDETFGEIINDQNGSKNLFELYSYIRDEVGFDFYTYYFDYDVFNEEPREMMFIDEGFFNVHKLECVVEPSSIPFFNNASYDCIPVILGYSYKNKYNVGDIILSDNGNQYVVSNFLKQNSFFLNPKGDDSFIYLNTAFICPITITAESDPFSIASAIERGYIITEDAELLSSVTEKAQSIDLPLNISFKSLKTQINNIIEDKLFDIYASSIIMALIVFLCITCMISSLLVFIDNHMKEFSIHILSGAAISDIAKRIIIQSATPILLAELASILFLHNAKSAMISVLITAVLCVTVVVIPIIKLYTLEIKEILKRCE